MLTASPPAAQRLEYSSSRHAIQSTAHGSAPRSQRVRASARADRRRAASGGHPKWWRTRTTRSSAGLMAVSRGGAAGEAADRGIRHNRQNAGYRERLQRVKRPEHRDLIEDIEAHSDPEPTA